MFLTGSTRCRRTHDFFLSIFLKLVSGNASELSGDKKAALDEAILRAAPIPLSLILERVRLRPRLLGAAGLPASHSLASDGPEIPVDPSEKNYVVPVSYIFSASHCYLPLNHLDEGQPRAYHCPEWIRRAVLRDLRVDAEFCCWVVGGHRREELLEVPRVVVAEWQLPMLRLLLC